MNNGKEAWKYCIFVCLIPFTGGGQIAKSNALFSVLFLLDLSAAFNQFIALSFLGQICHLASMTLHSFGSCSSSGYSCSVSSAGSLSFSWCLHLPEAERWSPKDCLYTNSPSSSSVMVLNTQCCPLPNFYLWPRSLLQIQTHISNLTRDKRGVWSWLLEPTVTFSGIF